jgi:hypothetical protein
MEEPERLTLPRRDDVLFARGVAITDNETSSLYGAQRSQLVAR